MSDIQQMAHMSIRSEPVHLPFLQIRNGPTWSSLEKLNKSRKLRPTCLVLGCDSCLGTYLCVTLGRSPTLVLQFTALKVRMIVVPHHSVVLKIRYKYVHAQNTLCIVVIYYVLILMTPSPFLLYWCVTL